MPIQFDKFEQSKVDRLKNHLVAMAAKNQAKFYEIYVDNLKAVTKTDVPDEFEGYEDYMRSDSSELKIVIYNTGNSPRNDQYVFMLKAKDSADANEIGLSGVELKSYSQNDIAAWRQTRIKKTAEQEEISSLKKENSELRQSNKVKDLEIEKLSEIVITAKENGNKIGGIHWGEIASVALEGLARRNPEWIAQLPMGEELAGIIIKDNERLAAKTPEKKEGDASFKKKDNSPAQSQPTKDDIFFIEFLKELKNYFDEKEILAIMDIIDLLSQDKSKITEILNSLSEKKK